MQGCRRGAVALRRITAALEDKVARFEARLRGMMAAASPETLAGLPYHLVLQFGPPTYCPPAAAGWSAGAVAHVQ